MALKNQIIQSLITLLTTLDSDAFAPLQPHKGKVIALHILPFSPLYFQIQDNQLVLCEAQPENVLFEGHLQAFIAMGLKPEAKNTPDLHIRGDMNLAKAFYDSWRQMDWDVEGLLAQYIGPTLAVQLSKGGKALKNWTKATLDNRQQDIKNYLQHERKYLPTMQAIERFYQDINTLRNDLDRFEAKLAQMEKR